MSLYVKRLERDRFIWPSPAEGAVSISTTRLARLLDAIDWRYPRADMASDGGGMTATR